jgi:hypothetical protein
MSAWNQSLLEASRFDSAAEASRRAGGVGVGVFAVGGALGGDVGVGVGDGVGVVSAWPVCTGSIGRASATSMGEATGGLREKASATSFVLHGWGSR